MLSTPTLFAPLFGVQEEFLERFVVLVLVLFGKSLAYHNERRGKLTS